MSEVCLVWQKIKNENNNLSLIFYLMFSCSNFLKVQSCVIQYSVLLYCVTRMLFSFPEISPYRQESLEQKVTDTINDKMLVLF